MTNVYSDKLVGRGSRTLMVLSLVCKLDFKKMKSAIYVVIQILPVAYYKTWKLLYALKPEDFYHVNNNTPNQYSVNFVNMQSTKQHCISKCFDL